MEESIPFLSQCTLYKSQALPVHSRHVYNNQATTFKHTVALSAGWQTIILLGKLCACTNHTVGQLSVLMRARLVSHWLHHNTI